MLIWETVDPPSPSVTELEADENEPEESLPLMTPGEAANDGGSGTDGMSGISGISISKPEKGID